MALPVRRRRLAITALVLLVLVAVGVGIGWWLKASARAAPADLRPPTATAAAHPLSRPSTLSAASSPPVPVPASPASGPPAPGACGPGLGDSPPAALATAASPAAERAPTALETERALSRLQTSSQALEVLAASALRATLEVEQTFQRAGPTQPPCLPGDAACTSQAQQRYQDITHAVYAASAGQAVALALRSGEPAAMQTALHLCAALPSSDRPACTGPLLRAWTTREPDNATPWLMLAAAEREQGDAQAAAEALYRASQAPRVADGSQGLWGVAAAPSFDSANGVAALDLQSRWAALIAGMNYASLGNLSELCGDTALRDGNQRQPCEVLARRLLQQGSSLIHRVEGLALGTRLGWPEDELLAVRQRVHALLKADSDDLQTRVRLDPCQSAQRHRERAHQLAQQGEVQRLERQLNRQPQSR